MKWLTVAALALGACTACRAREPVQIPMDMSGLDSTDERTGQAAHEAMSGPMAADPHMVLTPLRAATVNHFISALRWRPEVI